jgi:hypothetical protein
MWRGTPVDASPGADVQLRVPAEEQRSAAVDDGRGSSLLVFRELDAGIDKPRHFRSRLVRERQRHQSGEDSAIVSCV